MASRFISSARPAALGFTAAERSRFSSTDASTAHRERVTRRTPFRVPCRISVFGDPGGGVTHFCGQTVNISAGGLAVQLCTPIPEGTRVEAMVPQPEGDPLYLCGVVQHTRPVLTNTFEVGIRLDPRSEPANEAVSTAARAD